MGSWEYKVIKLNVKRDFWSGQYNMREIEKSLNEQGLNGWELVTMEGLSYRSVSFPILTFKRHIG